MKIFLPVPRIKFRYLWKPNGAVKTNYLTLSFSSFSLPPAARGTLFEKTAPLDPLQKLFIEMVFIVFFSLCPFV
ncbi:MAG: hypothetical protein PVH61_00890 [Candidatus Aminicenantes bacterium]|jgi:hypothetical protein